MISLIIILAYLAVGAVWAHNILEGHYKGQRVSEWLAFLILWPVVALEYFLNKLTF